MFAIGHQQGVGQALGQGCAGSGCAPASSAYSGVYNAHSAPHQGVQMGSLPFGFNVLQPGLNQPMPPMRPAVVGVAPIGNFMIAQSVPSANILPPSPPVAQPYQKVTTPVLVERGKPVVGANARVTDMGFVWQICETVDFGLMRQERCRTEPKFQ